MLERFYRIGSRRWTPCPTKHYTERGGPLLKCGVSQNRSGGASQTVGGQPAGVESYSYAEPLEMLGNKELVGGLRDHEERNPSEKPFVDAVHATVGDEERGVLQDLKLRYKRLGDEVSRNRAQTAQIRLVANGKHHAPVATGKGLQTEAIEILFRVEDGS
ncbi:MAG TPA: hypothetical protein VFU63_01490 [Ktedonobacterales bacterium]|nr:hypothetical protein [Ktedonobacterales bacterium]